MQVQNIPLGTCKTTTSKNQKIKHSIKSVIEGFEMDDKKYKELLRAVYEDDEILILKCKLCVVKTHSEGTLRMHENYTHFKKWWQTSWFWGPGDPSCGGLRDSDNYYVNFDNILIWK